MQKLRAFVFGLIALLFLYSQADAQQIVTHTGKSAGGNSPTLTLRALSGVDSVVVIKTSGTVDRKVYTTCMDPANGNWLSLGIDKQITLADKSDYQVWVYGKENCEEDTPGTLQALTGAFIFPSRTEYHFASEGYAIITIIIDDGAAG